MRATGTFTLAGAIVCALALLTQAAPAQAPAPVPTSAPVESPAPLQSPPPAASSAGPTSPAATAPPIIVEPPSGGVVPGGTQTLRVGSVLGTITVTVADPNIADASVDQESRTITLHGKSLGTTTMTVSDQRGLSRIVPVRVAYAAGSVADAVRLRITGDPANIEFVREQAAMAAARAARARAGAIVEAPAEGVTVNVPLAQDNLTVVDVPVVIRGNDYFNVAGTTHVTVINEAQPRIHPRWLMVSDFPETLRENGILFTVTLTRRDPARFLYFHFNPPGATDRRILLKAQNTSDQPALVQFISGAAGPGANEMEIGHLATQRFLVRAVQNEGNLLLIPGHATVNIVDHLMPANSVVSNILQLREVQGAALHLALLAQNAGDPTDTPIATTELLTSTVRHARGVYDIPEFFFETSWRTTDPVLSIPIGHIALPNKLSGEALAGDYGVLQSIGVRIANPDRSPAYVALYVSPRGGRATGTFLVDNVLVQSHGVPPFSHYKLRQYVVPAGGYINVRVITMPEGGSSYPLNLEFGLDDGSVAPGSAGSPVY